MGGHFDHACNRRHGLGITTHEKHGYHDFQRFVDDQRQGKGIRFSNGWKRAHWILESGARGEAMSVAQAFKEIQDMGFEYADDRGWWCPLTKAQTQAPTQVVDFNEVKVEEVQWGTI